MRSWINHINSAITFCIALLLFFVPLILWPKTSEVFEFNKMMFTYIITALLTALWLSKSVIERRFTIAKTPLDIPILVFFLSQLLSTIFSIDPHTSWWGYYSRFHGGLYSLLSYIILFYATLSHHRHLYETKSKHSYLNTPDTVFKFWIYSLISSAILVAVYGILEHFGIDKNLWVQDVQSRVFSTLGQPNWLSAYLVALLPIPIFYVYYSKRSLENFFWVITSLIFLLCIYYTKSRSGIFTAVFVLALSFIHLTILSLKNHRLTQTLPLWICVFIITLLSGTPFTPNISQITQRINNGGPVLAEIEPQLNNLGLSSQFKKPPVIPPTAQQIKETEARQKGKLVGGSDSFDIRKVVWEGSLNLVKQRPLLGTGVETFGYSYYWTRPVAHNQLSEWDFLYNKAHNEYLNYLATTGVVGFTAYLGLLLAIFIALLRNIKRDEPLPAAFFYGWISILITNFFGFSVVPVAVLFFIYPALSLTSSKITLRLIKTSNHSNQEPTTVDYVFLTTLSFSFLFVTTVIASHWLADVNYNLGKAYSNAQYLVQSLPYLEKSIKLYPDEPIFIAELAQAQAQTAAAFDQQIKSVQAAPNATPSGQAIKQAIAQKDSYIKLAIENINKALQANPYNLNTYKTKAKVEIYLGSIDQSYYLSSLKTLAKANELAPTDPKIVYNMGLLYDHLGQTSQAELAFKKTLELKSNYDQARVSYIELLKKQNNIPEAKVQVQKLIEDYPEYEVQYKDIL